MWTLMDRLVVKGSNKKMTYLLLCRKHTSPQLEHPVFQLAPGHTYVFTLSIDIGMYVMSTGEGGPAKDSGSQSLRGYHQPRQRGAREAAHGGESCSGSIDNGDKFFGKPYGARDRDCALVVGREKNLQLTASGAVSLL